MREAHDFTDGFDMKAWGREVFPALGVLEEAVKKEQEAGVSVRFHCPTCTREAEVLCSRTEIFSVAHNVRPRPGFGTDTLWQASARGDAYGPAIACTSCSRHDAPFVLTPAECQETLSRYPSYEADPEVLRIANSVRIESAMMRLAGAPWIAKVVEKATSLGMRLRDAWKDRLGRVDAVKDGAFDVPLGAAGKGKASALDDPFDEVMASMFGASSPGEALRKENDGLRAEVGELHKKLKAFKAQREMFHELAAANEKLLEELETARALEIPFGGGESILAPERASEAARGAIADNLYLFWEKVGAAASATDAHRHPLEFGLEIAAGVHGDFQTILRSGTAEAVLETCPTIVKEAWAKPVKTKWFQMFWTAATGAGQGEPS